MELKNKIEITKEFLNDLETKSWQEIEYLQDQIANIEPTKNNEKLIQLLKNLLTSYYVFTGSIENLATEEPVVGVAKFTDKVCADRELVAVNTRQVPEVIPEDEEDLFEPLVSEEEAALSESEPFEYFVDFDEPTGDPISDEDLYGN